MSKGCCNTPMCLFHQVTHAASTLVCLDRHPLELVILVVIFWTKLQLQTTAIIQKSSLQDWVLSIVWVLRCTGECASRRSIFFQSWLVNVAGACIHAFAAALLWDYFIDGLAFCLWACNEESHISWQTTSAPTWYAHCQPLAGRLVTAR